MQIWYTITGGIDQNVAQQLITWVNGQLYPQSDIQRLTIFLSSTGGDIDSAIRIYSYLRGLPINVEIIGISQIDSAANIIFLAANVRKALRGCRFFLHEGTFNIGNQTAVLHAHEETLVLLQTLLNRTIEIISTRTDKDAEQIGTILREGKIYSTQEAIDFGLATEIIEQLPRSLNT